MSNSGIIDIRHIRDRHDRKLEILKFDSIIKTDGPLQETKTLERVSNLL